MALEFPESMDECIYFTRRKTEEDGTIVAWSKKITCPDCGEAKMGKPVEKGKIKIRAKTYVCPGCGHEEEKHEHEDKLVVEVQYTCPHCSHSGETKIPYKRKKWKGVDAQVFVCDGCGEKIGITKKMKKPKPPKKKK